MKKHPSLLPVIIVALNLTLAGELTAQTFTTLYSFGGGSDGYQPESGLLLSNNILYGAAYHGGTSGVGSVFAIYTDGSGFTNLYNFTGGVDVRVCGSRAVCGSDRR